LLALIHSVSTLVNLCAAERPQALCRPHPGVGAGGGVAEESAHYGDEHREGLVCSHESGGAAGSTAVCWPASDVDRRDFIWCLEFFNGVLG